LCYSPKQHFLCLGASSCLFVLQVPPPGLGMCPGLVPSGGSIPPPGFGFGCCCCSRATCNRSCLLCALVCGVTRRTAAARRSALFSVFVGVGRFSGVNKIGRLFGGASPLGCAFGLRLRAAPSGCAFGLRLRARPKPRLDSEPMGDARGRSRIPHKTPTADRGRSYGKKWPCGVLERFLLHLLCLPSAPEWAAKL